MKLPVTVLLAVKNEALNLPRCLGALAPAQRVVLLDSASTDATPDIAKRFDAELVQFRYGGGYPKKRQWALDTLHIDTPWVLLLDADEFVPPGLWEEIGGAIAGPDAPAGFFITKGFHFLGRRMRFGGFSHGAILLFKTGTARFERTHEDAATGMDMEVHERVIVDGGIGQLHTPLVHEDFKGLEAYIDRHNKYSTWESRLRFGYLRDGRYGADTIQPRLFGNAQERRRYVKALIIRLPFEGLAWFFYHYVVRLGFLEGRPGLIAAQIRASYISQVRAKLFELKRRQSAASNRAD